MLERRAGGVPRPGGPCSSVRQALHAVQHRGADRFVIDLRGQRGSLAGPGSCRGGHRGLPGRPVRRRLGCRQVGPDPAGRGRSDRPRRSGGGPIRQIPMGPRRDRGYSPGVRPIGGGLRCRAGDCSLWEREFAARSGPPEWTAGDRNGLVSLLAAGRPGWEALLGLWESGWLSRAIPEIAHLQRTFPGRPFPSFILPMPTSVPPSPASSISPTAPSDGAGIWQRRWAAWTRCFSPGFLHDIGKGLGGDHSNVGADLAVSFLQRTGFGAATVSVVGPAVRHHLLLSETAFRKDIEDPAVVAEVARCGGKSGPSAGCSRC